jgi:hypothetical protein
MAWSDELRRCSTCRAEYRPKREAQTYCSPRCKRDAAYTRERLLKKGAKKPRKRHLGIPIPGSVRNGPFYPMKTRSCRAPQPPVFAPLDLLGRGHRWAGAIRLKPGVWERILWCEIGIT